MAWQLNFNFFGLLPRRSEEEQRCDGERLVVGRDFTMLSESALYEIWQEVRTTWFPESEVLEMYGVCWSSRRQKNTLALCDVRKKQVRVARELQYLAYIQMIRPLLYHEMCHAVIGFKRSERGRCLWHGKEFRDLERANRDILLLEQWIREGGWARAIRSDRARRRYAKAARR